MITMNFIAQIGSSQQQDVVVGWGTLALLNAGIAQGKNRGGLNWFLPSMLLGPLASLILVTLETLPPNP